MAASAELASVVVAHVGLLFSWLQPSCSHHTPRGTARVVQRWFFKRLLYILLEPTSGKSHRGEVTGQDELCDRGKCRGPGYDPASHRLLTWHSVFRVGLRGAGGVKSPNDSAVTLLPTAPLGGDQSLCGY